MCWGGQHSSLGYTYLFLFKFVIGLELIVPWQMGRSCVSDGEYTDRKTLTSSP